MELNEKPLLPRQEKFCQEYAICTTIEEAVEKAGYSNKGQNGRTGQYLLRDYRIEKRINFLRNLAVEKKFNKTFSIKDEQNDKEILNKNFGKWLKEHKSIKKETLSNSSQGFLYLIGNKAWSGIKIGQASAIEKRIKQYNQAQIEPCYIIDWHPVCTTKNQDEQTLIKAFDKYITNNYTLDYKKGNEWFLIDDVIATKIFRQTLEDIRQEYIRKIKF